MTLQQQRWINNQTRAVILGQGLCQLVSMSLVSLEFATYNVNINLFVVATVIAEWLPGIMQIKIKVILANS